MVDHYLASFALYPFQVLLKCFKCGFFFLFYYYAIFRLISERENPEESYSLEMSVCEIYNNEVRDLLAGKSASRVRICTTVRW